MGIAGAAAASTENLANDVMEGLRKYHYNNKLQDILVNAILSEMDNTEQEILSQGIMTLNRQVSNMNSDSVVDYLLLHSSIHEFPVINQDLQQQNDDDVHCECGDNLDIDFILNDVDQLGILYEDEEDTEDESECK